MGLSDKRRRVLAQAFTDGYNAHKSNKSSAHRHSIEDVELSELWYAGYRKAKEEFSSPEALRQRQEIADTTDVTVQHVVVEKKSFFTKLKDFRLLRRHGGI